MDGSCQSKLAEEELRKYLFGNRTFHYWNGRLENLLVGVEAEYIIHRKGEPGSLLRKQDFIRLIESLVKVGFKKNMSPNAHPYRVSKDTEVGFLSITPDFAFHIVEIALPPRADINSLTSLFSETLELLDLALGSLGFERSKSSYIPCEKSAYDLVELHEHKSFSETSRVNVSNEFFTQDFPAKIASTHIHLNIGSEDSLKMLPALYELEWYSSKLFSNSQTIEGQVVHDIRSLLYRDCLGDDYLLKNVPKEIPKNITEYLRLYNSSPQLFPNKSFFPVKDLCLIRPTSVGTFEFRSADSVSDPKELLKIVGFRIGQLIYATNYQDNPIDRRNTWQSESHIFHSLEKNQSPNLEKEQQSLRRMISSIQSIKEDSNWTSTIPVIGAA